MPDLPNNADIRQFLFDFFNDEELATLCFDFFPEVQDNFAAGMTKQQKILELLGYCQRREIVPNLLAALQRVRPEPYSKRFPQAAQAETRRETARPQRDPKQVFISHAHEDAEFAHRLANDLRQNGWRVWIAPDSIRPGEKWLKAVRNGLEGSTVFVLVLTPSAVKSHWVEDETDEAISLANNGLIHFVSLDVKPCEVPLFWRQRQSISFQGDYERGLTELLDTLEPDRRARREREAREETERVEQEQTQVTQKTNEQTANLLSQLTNAEIRSDWDTVIQLGEHILKLIPDNQSIRIRIAEAYWSRSMAAYGQNQALTDFDRAIELNPNEAKYHFDRALHYLLQQAWDPAIESFDRAIELAPTHAEYYKWRGHAYHYKGDLDNAIADLSHAIGLDSTQADYYYERGVSYHNKGDYDRAIANYNRAIALDPNNADYSYSRGLSHELNEDWPSALQDFQHAAKLGSADARRELEAAHKGQEIATQGEAEQQVRPAKREAKAEPLKQKRQERPARLERILAHLRDPLWQGIGAIVAIAALAVALGAWLWPDIHAALFPSTTPTPPRTSTITSSPAPTLSIGSTRISEKDAMVMVYVPAGEFLMGSADSDKDASSDEKPQHKVYLDALWIDQTEVTNIMFTHFVSATGYKTDAEKLGSGYTYAASGWSDTKGADWQHPGGPNTNIRGLDNHPAVLVSWNDAKAYCEWAGRQLPTEAQWEKAARGTDGRIYPWGNQSATCEYAVMDDGSGNGCGKGNEAWAVGSKPKGISPYGAMDMAGNVWEWVADWYDEKYYGSSPPKNPPGPTSGQYRVLRGGSWDGSALYVRTAYRNRSNPENRFYNIGFRCSRGTSP